MINTIFEQIARIFTVLWNDLTMINVKVPVISIALGIFLVATLSRFFIIPMLKDGLKANSDSAEKKKGKKKK